MGDSVATDSRAEDGFLERRFSKWVLLDGDRGALAGILAVTVYILVLTATNVGLVPLEDMQPLYYLYSALIGGNITLITVVVSINQLVLSQELNRPGELEHQIEGTVSYRNEVGEDAGEEPPADPQGFLAFLTHAVREQVNEVRTLVDANADDAVEDDAIEVLAPVSEHLDRVDQLLEHSGASTFDVLSATLYTDYATVIARLKRLQSREGDRLGAATCVAIDELVDRLVETNVAQQYFKTIYLQQGLAKLSRQLFYVGIPAVLSVAFGLMLLTAARGPSVTIGAYAVLHPAIVTIGLLPLLVLFSYMLRVGTVAERTAATAPFTTPTQRSDTQADAGSGESSP